MDEWLSVAAGFFGAITGSLLGPLAADWVQNLGSIRVGAGIISSPEPILIGDSGKGTARVVPATTEDFQNKPVVLQYYASVTVENAKRRPITVMQPRLFVTGRGFPFKRKKFGTPLASDLTDWLVPAGAAKQIRFGFAVRRREAQLMAEHQRWGLQLRAVGVRGWRRSYFDDIYVRDVIEVLTPLLAQLSRARTQSDQ